MEFRRCLSRRFERANARAIDLSWVCLPGNVRRPNNCVRSADSVPASTPHRASRKFNGSWKQTAHVIRKNRIRWAEFSIGIKLNGYQEDWCAG